jgi:hypothetical protein
VTDATSLSADKHRLQLRRAVIASTIRTAIEWCDDRLYRQRHFGRISDAVIARSDVTCAVIAVLRSIAARCA